MTQSALCTPLTNSLWSTETLGVVRRLPTDPPTTRGLPVAPQIALIKHRALVREAAATNMNTQQLGLLGTLLGALEKEVPVRAPLVTTAMLSGRCCNLPESVSQRKPLGEATPHTRTHGSHMPDSCLE